MARGTPPLPPLSICILLPCGAGPPSCGTLGLGLARLGNAAPRLACVLYLVLSYSMPPPDTGCREPPRGTSQSQMRAVPAAPGQAEAEKKKATKEEAPKEEAPAAAAEAKPAVAVSAAAVKQLREKTGAGMMDCKKALAGEPPAVLRRCRAAVG